MTHRAGRAPGTINGAPTRRGMTLLEVVFAVVLLSLVAATVVSTITFVNASDMRAMKRLGAYEVANRLILQHLDDPKVMAGQESKPIDYDRFRYRWSLDESPIKMTVPDVVRADHSPSTPQAMDRFRLITVNVWAVDENQPPQLAAKGEKLATLTRMYDPLAGRNWNSIQNLTSDDIMKRLGDILQGQKIPQAGSTGTPRPGTTPSPAAPATAPSGGGGK